MAVFTKGDVVVIPFPFANLQASKARPALVIAVLPGADLILCLISSQSGRDRDAIPLTNADMRPGALRQPSNIRPGHLFTADEALVGQRLGVVSAAKMVEVTTAIIQILTR